MIRITLFLVLMTFLSPVTTGQVLKGKITNESGQPVQYATVYIQELRQGTTANTKGEYELKLGQGTYQVIFQSLGYGQVSEKISITGQPVVKNVKLPFQYYMIPEVRITATGEDPAYGIMRKAIGMAPYYLNNISYYKAEVYLKGDLMVNKIPKLIQKAMNAEARRAEKEGETGIRVREGDVYMLESFNEIEFTAPEKYSQRVISFQNTFPVSENDISPMDFINASFYQPLIADIAISPLSPQAFSYYRFQYLGATPQGNVTINKIRVIPKMKSQQLFDGTIYIIEDLWCIQSLDLSNENIAGKVSVQQLFIPVRDEIWMPVSHKFTMNLAMMGVRADVGYTGSVKYLEVKPNTSLRKPDPLATGFARMQASATPEKPLSKNQEKIEDILTKDEITNRDMVRLSKLMDQESEKARPDSLKESLEIKETYKRTVEKDASKKDSSYWADIRPVPLSELEMKSIRIRDSLRTESSLKKSKVITDSTISLQIQPKSRFGRTVRDIVFGRTWSDSSGLSFRMGGLIDIQNLSFNTVDGFLYGIDFRISKYWKNRNSLTVVPEFRYAFSREALLWRVNGTYGFNRMKQSSVSIRAGVISRDISTGGGINKLLNTATSLFFERNIMKLYESGYVTAGYRTEIVNGLNVSLTGAYENRTALENTTSFSLLATPREYTPNLPVNKYLDSTSNPVNFIKDQRHYDFSAELVYTPRQKYSISNGSKYSRGSEWPTFTLYWKHGVNEFNDTEHSYRHYDLIRFDISKYHNLGAFSELNWKIRTGSFLDNRYVPYYDFHHFNEQPLPLIIDNYSSCFRLPDYYSLSTPEFFGEVHIKYTTPYLLLKFIPGLSNTLMRENLSLSYLGSRHHKNYTEIGYSITELFLLGEAGVYAGFDDLRFRSAGLRLIIRLN
ncbi:MAG: carboxypeptidase-like regulatory domain-containing protein [Bacteroidales bacterium]|nr:carboxypeptidase-like regulatory domain-containing protein [Bacteroidales bacterium]MBN2634404.1 carboxypeptidase-like regulatory domain-containing protein [Bacteroidales bacterium]